MFHLISGGGMLQHWCILNNVFFKWLRRDDAILILMQYNFTFSTGEGMLQRWCMRRDDAILILMQCYFPFSAGEGMLQSLKAEDFDQLNSQLR